MEAVRPGRDGLPGPPFWRRLGARPAGRSPSTFPFVFPPGAFRRRRAQRLGDARPDRRHRARIRPELLGADRAANSAHPRSKDEGHRPFSVARLLEVRDELVHATEAVTGVAEDLARRESWDLFIAAYSATHRGGHKLWIDPAAPPPDDADGDASCARRCGTST